MSDLLTTKALQQIVGRSRVTIWLWRKRHGMPVVRIKGDTRDGIRYRLPAIRRWAKQTERLDLFSLLDGVLRAARSR